MLFVCSSMFSFNCTNYYKSYRNPVEFRLFKSDANQDILGLFRRGGGKGGGKGGGRGKARMTE